MKKWFLIALLGIAACSMTFAGGSKEVTAKTGDSGTKPLKIAVVLPGKIDDVSFNQAFYEGMKLIESEQGNAISVTYVEDVYEVADIEPALMDFASRGYDLIFGHGFQFMEPIIKVAEQFPDTCFALGTGYKSVINSCVYDVKLGQGGYLMGALAAMITETQKIGVIGGGDASEIYRGHEGFKMGARSINPNIEIQEFYTGDWRDAAKAKEGALGMYDSGVDVIWHSGDGIGLGVVNAGLQSDKLVLSNIINQNVLAPNNVVSGIDYRWDLVIRDIVQDVLDGNFLNRENKFYWIDVANKGLQVSSFNQFKDQYPASVFEKMNEIEKGILDGSIVIPEFEK
jgi:basic membrane protein A